MKKCNFDSFHQKLISKYGDKFDDSEFEYINSKTKGKLKCNKCGKILFVRPNDLLSNNQYHNCTYNNKKLTEKEYINKANIIHNNEYIYEDINLSKGVRSIIEVTCKLHGKFKIRANYHLLGNGCPICKKLGISHKLTLPNKKNNHSTNKLTQEEVIKRIGKKYDSSLVKYKNNDTYITLICHKTDRFGNEHGQFKIRPSHLFNGKGCPKCGNNKPKTTEEFIIESKLLRKDVNYSFEKTIYKKYHTPLILTCHNTFSNGVEHGDFEITPANFLSGKQGCPICKSSKLENEIEIFLKENNINYIRQCNKSTLPWLETLVLDFFLPIHNIAIECQGIQHFKPLKIFGGEINYNKTIARDKLKLERCVNNNVKLLYYSNLNITYPYKVFEDKNKLFEIILNNK